MLKSNGKALTCLEWRANRLVDAVAKNESARGQAPQASVDLVTSATALVQHTAAQLGAATHFANNHVTSVMLENGKIVNKTIRDVQDPPVKKRAAPVQPKIVVQKSVPVVEESSDWDTEDENHTYGPNTRRARKAAQKKVRRQAEVTTLQGVIADIQAGMDEGRKEKKSGEEKQLEAAKTLSATANSRGESEKATSSQTDTRNRTRSSSETWEGAPAVKKTRSEVGSRGEAVTVSRASRERPKRRATCTSASETAAAVLALLNG